MKQGFRNSIGFLGQFIPLQLLRKGKNIPPFLPFYHEVSDVDLDYINSYGLKSNKQFEKELDYLLKYFVPVGLNEILKAPAKNKMHLSFDDGLKSCSSVIAPILKRKGIPATFFVSPDFVDNKSIFHRFKQAILESKGLLIQDGNKYFIHETNTLDKIALQHGVDFSAYQPYMNLNEIQSLKIDGFTIGAHSMNHPEMWTLSENEQYRQVIESIKWVIDHFDPDIKAFSFPFTDAGIKQSLFNRLNESKLIDVTFGTAGLKYDDCKINFQRIPVELKQNWSVQKVVHFEYFYCKIRNLLSVNQIKR